MNDAQKVKIHKMRMEGIGYKAIATSLDLPLGTVKSFCKRYTLTGLGMVVAMNHAVSVQKGLICKQCGARLKHTAGKKRKVFCSDKCRKKYWKSKNEVKENGRTN